MQTKTILIIEDEETLREMYQKKFAMAGCRVILANNAKLGINRAKTEKPDLILLDILLPKQGGIYVLEQLRANQETAKLNVLVFSNFDDALTKKRAKELGALDYLIKTAYTPEQITKVIRKYLNSK